MTTKIVFDPETGDFAFYVNGQLKGFASSKPEAQEEIDRIVYRRLNAA